MLDRWLDRLLGNGWVFLLVWAGTIGLGVYGGRCWGYGEGIRSGRAAAFAEVSGRR